MPVEFIDNVAMKHSMSASEIAGAKQLIASARAETAARRKHLHAAVKTGDAAGQLAASSWLLENPKALLTSAITANKKLKPRKRQPLEVLFNVANTLNFAQPLAEVVPVYPRLKASGGHRMIHNPGIRHRTAQDGVAGVMGCYFVPRNFQFTHLGVQAAIKRVKQAIGDGFVHIARLDIKNFFPSFDPDALGHALPLSKEVVDYVVSGRHMETVMDKETRKSSYAVSPLPHTQELLIQARLGIPLGSGCSPIVGMYVVSQLAWSSVPAVLLINYADDFLLLALDPVVLDEAVGELTGAVSGLPGGKFKLALKAKRNASNGFEFLGHHLQLVDGVMKAKPTEQNVQDFYRKLDKLDEKIGKFTCFPGQVNKAAALKCAAHMMATIDGWEQAFSECDKMESRWLVLPLDKIVENLGLIGATTDEVAAAVESWMYYEPSDYSLGH